MPICVEPFNSYDASTWKDTERYEEWRGQANIQTDYAMIGGTARSPRIGVTGSLVDMGYNLNRTSPTNNNNIPYTMIDAHGRGALVGVALGLGAKHDIGNGFASRQAHP